MFCTSCGANLPENTAFCTVCGAKLNSQPSFTPPPAQPAASASAGMDFDFSTNTASAASYSRFEYKILSQKDKWFSGKFDPLILEQAINAYAQQGWRVIGCATADIPGFGGPRQEFITLLEREVK